MSSSTSSQWIPTPRPMSRQLARCWGVARRSRGNHANGAETRRPSTRVTINSSSVHATSTASATGLLAKVLIPGNDKLLTVFRNGSSAVRGVLSREHEEFLACGANSSVALPITARKACRRGHARRVHYPEKHISAGSRKGQASSLCSPITSSDRMFFGVAANPSRCLSFRGCSRSTSFREHSL